VTLLVGENSSGKSTFLALCQIASAIARGFVRRIPFNDAPFLLGAYDQIASYRGGRAGRVKSFHIALTVQDTHGASSSLRTQFVPLLGQPAVQLWRLSVGKDYVELRMAADSEKATLVAEGSKGKIEVSDTPVQWAWDFIYEPTRRVSRDLMTAFSESEIVNFRNATESIRDAFFQNPYAFAPIRTSPERTYDPVIAEPEPIGTHVPMLLAQLSHAATKREWAALQSGLSEFGSSAGLFERIEVIRKGKKASDPFQIGVKTGGPAFNLVDVGYGVSQVLPILVDTIQQPNQTFLMQQPEVHLHPRAQAELGTFFARRARKGQRFVIETHSDYLVDRVRMEVRRRNLLPQDVSLLYFERKQSGAMIHAIQLGEDGGIIDPPDGYRQFFLDEERSVLDV
jgi:putative AbiEii toxin of type IV toxin-antitoxin system